MNESIVTDPANFPSVFDSALNTADLDQLLRLYETQASFRASDGTTHQGQHALRQEMQGLIDAQARLNNKLVHLLQSGEIALIVVDWTLGLNLPDIGPIQSKGTATNVLRLSPEHGWRLLIANPQGVAQ